MGAAARLFYRLAGRDHPRRDHAQAVQFRGDRRDRRGAHHLDPGRRRARGATGTTAFAGCATPSSWCARSTASARRARWKTTSPTSSPSPPAAPTTLQAAVRRRAHRFARGAHRAERSPAISGDGRCASAMPRSAQDQHDVYGSIILAATPMFFDRRLPQAGDEACSVCWSRSASRRRSWRSSRTAGIWEYRGTQARAHPFGGDVLGRLPAAGGDRRASRACRSRRILGRHRRQASASEVLRTRLESETQGVFRRPSAATISMPASCLLRRTRADRARRSAFRLHRRRDRA